MIDKGLYKKAPAAKSQLVYESDKRLGYRGIGGYQSGKSAPASGGGSKSSSGGGNKSGGGGNTGGGGNNKGGGADFSTVKSLPPTMTTLPSNIPTSDNKTFTISTNPMDLKEQYGVGNVPTNVTGVPSFVTFDNPYSSLGLEQQRYDNFVDARNLSNMNYPGVTGKVPAFIPYSGVINTGINFLSGLIGKKGFEVNTDFFAENVAGKYGYGYGYDDYKEYMKDRMAGKVNAYGRTLTDAEKGGRDDGGIMQVSEINPLLPIEEDDDENQTAKNYDFNYGTASNPIYYSDLV